jgi:hypothetical protein
MIRKLLQPVTFLFSSVFFLFPAKSNSDLTVSKTEPKSTKFSYEVITSKPLTDEEVQFLERYGLQVKIVDKSKMQLATQLMDIKKP